MREYGYPIKYP